MDDFVGNEEDALLYKKIQNMQETLDKGWNKPKQYFINGYPVSYEEYWDWQEQQKIADAQLDAELSFYKRCTSTGEEWEIDCDGEYTPEEFWDK